MNYNLYCHDILRLKDNFPKKKMLIMANDIETKRLARQKAFDKKNSQVYRASEIFENTFGYYAGLCVLIYTQ